MNFSKPEKILLGLLAAAKFTHIMDFMVMMPLGPQLMRVLKINTLQFGILVSSYTFSAGIALLLSSFFIDRIDRRKALLVAYAGFFLGTLACGLVQSYELLIFARMLTGVFGGILNALILSTVGDNIPIQKRASAMGIVMSAFSAAAAFGVPFGVLMASLGSWNWPFLILAILIAPILFALIRFLPEAKKEAPTATKVGPLDVLQRVFTNANQLRALGLAMLLVLSQFMIIPYISPYMVGNIGFSELQLVYIYLLGGTLTLFTGPWVGRVADRIGHRKSFLIFAALSMFPLIVITHLIHLPWVSIPIALIVSSLFFIFISGRIIPSTTMIVSSVEGKYRAGFMSISAASQQLAAGFAATISGALVTEAADKSIGYFEYVGYLAVVLTIVAMFIGARVRAVEE